jgi:hypothetical protein
VGIRGVETELKKNGVIQQGSQVAGYLELEGKTAFGEPVSAFFSWITPVATDRKMWVLHYDSTLVHAGEGKADLCGLKGETYPHAKVLDTKDVSAWIVRKPREPDEVVDTRKNLLGAGLDMFEAAVQAVMDMELDPFSFGKYCKDQGLILVVI